MSEMVSMAEIQRDYDSEWVLLEDPQTSESLEIQKAKVLFHSKDRDEVYRKAREVHPKHSAIIYTGVLPKEAVVVL